MQIIMPEHWKDYELIDSGNFEKLERFGNFVLSRPEPQALWDKALPDEEWKRLSNAVFKRTKGKAGDDGEKGEWLQKPGMPGQWFVDYRYKEMAIRMRLGLTSFKHVGLFPEQAGNWNYIYDTIKSIPEKTNVLNLFAYTGGASLAARAAGADVTHVDSVKQVITWANENLKASSMDGVRWLVEDAAKFVQREARRGNRYNGIILDPPAYGRGPEGEKWVLEDQISSLLKQCGLILKPHNSFVVLNLYSMGFSPLIADNLLTNLLDAGNTEAGEFCFADRAGRKLPLGIFARFRTVKTS